jgi:hypothetical protein
MCGIQIDALEGTTTYGIYQVGANDKNYFNGNVGIGVTPSYKLHVLNQSSQASTRAFHFDSSTTTTSTASLYKLGGSIKCFDDIANGITNNGYIKGLSVEAEAQGAGTINDIYGIYSTTTFSSSASATNLYGAYISVTSQSTGHIGTSYGLYIYSEAGGSTIDTAYGIYIADQDATNGYGVYQASANDKNYFGGKTGFGVDDPDYAVEIMSSSNQLKLSYNSSVSSTMDVNVSGDLILNCMPNKTLVLSGVVYDDIRILPGAFSFSGTNDPTQVSYLPGGSGLNTFLYEFALNDYATFTCQMPHDYKEGTDISVHVHWTPGYYGVDEIGHAVGWKVSLSWQNIWGAFDSMTTYNTGDVSYGYDNYHQMSVDTTISGTGKKISSMIIGRITRTDTGSDDTWAGTATGHLPLLLEVDFHYQKDTLGSRTLTTK